MINRPSGLALKLIPMTGLLAVSLIASALAAAPTLNLTITPTNPYVDDGVRVAFTDTRSLPAGSEINVVLFGTGVCSSSVADKSIKGPKAAGRRYNLRFRPSDQIVGSGVEWCQGKAKVRIVESKNESFVRKLGEQTLRFRAKP
jgi:hypothetical protein